MAEAQKRQKESPETVLLRHPQPKYNFQARKLPKESPVAATRETKTTSQLAQAQDISTATLVSPGQVANAVSSANSGMVSGFDRKSAAVKPFSASVKSDNQATVTGSVAAAKPVAAVVAPNIRSGKGSQDKEDLAHAKQAPSSSGKGMQAAMTYLPSITGNSLESNDIPVPDAALLAHAVEGPSMEEKLQQAEQEIKMLRSQLEVQLQVNAEVKRLLVASVGEDFERKVESLARDRAQLAMELGDFTKKMTEDYENLDQISIQADMWRSKYLASRVMVEELASARAFFSSQFQDSQQAIQELMNERYELRTGLVQSYKCLQQVKEAFDPFNAQKSHSLPSTNVLDLAKHIKQLSEAVRFRLLPAHAGSHVMMPLEESWENTMTKAELLAYDQLSKQTAPPSFKHSLPSAPVLTTSKSYERFHPLVRHDNVTVNCCGKCKGEIKVA